ncbi:hypothetical protein [Polaromonas sp.]|uniref:hypothetical protein n=1 Tax=Polaromonas sp. TaxID=1869339 RepID=UPI00286C6D04|nr:hypothetical protein [Polaromonas sp.]
MTLHNAPPVVYPLGRSRFQGFLLLGLWLAGAVALLLWVFTTGQLGWRMAVAGVAVLAAGMAAHRGWKSTPTGQLAWDGQAWCWESPGYQAGTAQQQLSVIADVQRLLLLRLENPAQASLWLWAERSAMPERWLDLRRAVFATPRAAAVPPAMAVSGDMNHDPRPVDTRQLKP